MTEYVQMRVVFITIGCEVRDRMRDYEAKKNMIVWASNDPKWIHMHDQVMTDLKNKYGSQDPNRIIREEHWFIGKDWKRTQDLEDARVFLDCSLAAPPGFSYVDKDRVMIERVLGS